MVNIVPIVTSENTAATNTIPKMLSVAAGYIKMGTRGSHGQNTNMVNRIQGVMLFLFSL